MPADLVLSSDHAASSLYTWGWESYNASTGACVIWVLIPSYSASASIYISFGQAAISTYQGGSVGSEFDSATNIVYHQADGTTLSLQDSSVNAQTQTNVGGATAAAGEIGGGAGYAGSQALTVPDGALTTPASFTASLWVKRNGSQPAYGRLFGKGASDVAPYGSYGTIWNSTDATSLVFGVGFSDGTPAGPSTSTGLIANLTWYKVDQVWDDSTQTVYGYINGSQVATATYAGKSIASSAGTTLCWGAGKASNGLLSGQLTGSTDEEKLSATVRSAAWLATEYANQSSPPSMTAFVPLSQSQVIIF